MVVAVSNALCTCDVEGSQVYEVELLLVTFHVLDFLWLLKVRVCDPARIGQVPALVASGAPSGGLWCRFALAASLAPFAASFSSALSPFPFFYFRRRTGTSYVACAATVEASPIDRIDVFAPRLRFVFRPASRDFSRDGPAGPLPALTRLFVILLLSPL